MSSKRHVLLYEDIDSIIHRDFIKVTLIITAESMLFKDREFMNGLKRILSRTCLSYEPGESYPNKLFYYVRIDYNRFKILTDFSNSLMRDINVLLEPKGLKNGESFVKHHTIWMKLP